jgi:hypothetical protein
VNLAPVRGDAWENGYRVTHRGSRWRVGVNPVMFGTRVVAWRQGSHGPTVDYCAGRDSLFLSELLATVATIMRGLPDEISEAELARRMPRWEVRPINGDPCWPALQRMAWRMGRPK